MDNISKQIGSSYDVTIEQMARITTSYYCEKHEKGLRETFDIEPIVTESDPRYVLLPFR